VKPKGGTSKPGFGRVLDHGGARETSISGGVRESAAGKGRFDLIPARPYKRLAVHYEAGSLKYEPRGWEKGLPLARFLDSLERHLNAFKAGDRTEDHLAAIIWNAFGYIETEARVEEGRLPKELYDVPWPPSLP
jgi:hypothetical protein